MTGGSIEKQLTSLITELEVRTAELLEARAEQAATAEVLKAISRSGFDLQAVLNILIESAVKLGGSQRGGLYFRDGDVLRLQSYFGFTNEHVEHLRKHPIRVSMETMAGRPALLGRTVHIPDILADHDFKNFQALAVGRFRAFLGVPLIRDGEVFGVIGMNRPEPLPFTDRQIEMVESFATQAVIAIENTRLFDETRQSLQQQTATAQVLKVISRSAFDLQPVLDTLVASAAQLCSADAGVIWLRKGDLFHAAASSGISQERTNFFKDNPRSIHDNSLAPRVLRMRRTVHIPDRSLDPEFAFPGMSMPSSMIGVPLLRDHSIEGVFTLSRTNVSPFTPRQIELVESFADQAVIAIENARLINEIRQALERQTATAEILKVIASSPSDVQPVFNSIAESARRVVSGFSALVSRVVGDELHLAAYTAGTEAGKEALAQTYPYPLSSPMASAEAVRTSRVVMYVDAEKDASEATKSVARARGFRSVLAVPLLLEGAAIGTINVTRVEPGGFDDNEISLMHTFADQAVIAIENARLFDEVQAKTRYLTEALEQQTATSEILQVISSSQGDLDPVFNKLLENATRVCGANFGSMNLYENGEFRQVARYNIPGRARSEIVRPHPASGLATAARTKRVVQIEDIRAEAPYRDGAPEVLFLAAAGARTLFVVPMLREDELLGTITLYRQEVRPFTDQQIELVVDFARQAVIAIENTRLLRQLRERTEALTRSLDNLRAAQDRLVQTEKLASLGQLTAGIAHEIKNPLNFVNNFSAVSAELTDELKDVLRHEKLSKKGREETDELTSLLKENLGKVVQHGKRADSIVKNMLLHSRQGSGEHRPVDINAVVDESLNLAYHGARAENTGFNITIRRSFDPVAGTAEGYPQEIARALLNLISNGFYAAIKKKSDVGDGFEPILTATTKNLGDKVEIRIRDNGTGIPNEIQEKIFNPFFTTKPAGEGTGLGLSMSHDIIVKQHGGLIEVDTEPGAFTEFIVTLPRTNSVQSPQRSTN